MLNINPFTTNNSSSLLSPINTLAEPGWYNDPQKVWGGEAPSPDSVYIIVSVNGQNPVSVPVIDGRFLWMPSQPLPDGEYVLTFVTVDHANNPGQPISVKYNIDTVAPDKPLITAIEDRVTGGVQDGNSIDRDGYTNDANPLIRGQAEANSLVYIYDKNSTTPLASVKTNAQGEWEIQLNLPDDGSYELSAVAEDRADNRSEPSLTWKFQLDTEQPDGATISYYQDDIGLYRGQFGFNRPTDDKRPELHGRGEAGEYVSLQYASKNGSWITTATVMVDSNGNWAWTPPQDLSDGEWHFRVRSTDHAGNSSSWSNTTTLNIDTSTIQPTILQAIDNVGPISNVSPGQTTDDARLDFSGKAEANSLVTLYQGNVTVGSAYANASGDWTITPLQDMYVGVNYFSVKAIDEAGNESSYSANYMVNFKPAPKFERYIENWESRGNADWATGVTYTYGNLKVTELQHGNTYKKSYNGISDKIVNYSGKGVMVLNNSILKFDFGETDCFSFNYGNLHNHDTQIRIYSPDGRLLSIQPVPYHGNIHNESQTKLFSYQASAGQTIGYIEIHSAADPSYYVGLIKYSDSGWDIDTMTWGSGKVGGFNSMASTDAQAISNSTPGEIHIADAASWMNTVTPQHAENAGAIIIDGAQEIIDFTELSARVNGMQKIDITGSGNNLLNLDLKALLTEGGNGLFIHDTSKQFMINGNAGDAIVINRADLSDGWLMSQDKVVIGGENWSVLTNSKEQYTLLVNQEVDITYS